MRKIKLRTLVLTPALLLFSVLVVHAQSETELQPREANQKALSVQSKDKAQPESISQKPVSEASQQGYEMIMDAFGELAGEYEWDSDQIPVRSADQPSATWISRSDNYILEPGFVHASFVMPGEAAADGAIDIGQVMHLINCLFIVGSKPSAIEDGDANRDGSVDVADVMWLMNYLFIGGSRTGP